MRRWEALTKMVWSVGSTHPLHPSSLYVAYAHASFLRHTSRQGRSSGGGRKHACLYIHILSVSVHT